MGMPLEFRNLALIRPEITATTATHRGWR
jgi:hypothetical protein